MTVSVVSSCGSSLPPLPSSSSSGGGGGTTATTTTADEVAVPSSSTAAVAGADDTEADSDGEVSRIDFRGVNLRTKKKGLLDDSADAVHQQPERPMSWEGELSDQEMSSNTITNQSSVCIYFLFLFSNDDRMICYTFLPFSVRWSIGKITIFGGDRVTELYFQESCYNVLSKLILFCHFYYKYYQKYIVWFYTLLTLKFNLKRLITCICTFFRSVHWPTQALYLIDYATKILSKLLPYMQVCNYKF